MLVPTTVLPKFASAPPAHTEGGFMSGNSELILPLKLAILFTSLSLKYRNHPSRGDKPSGKFCVDDDEDCAAFSATLRRRVEHTSAKI